MPSNLYGAERNSGHHRFPDSVSLHSGYTCLPLNLIGLLAPSKHEGRPFVEVDFANTQRRFLHILVSRGCIDHRVRLICQSLTELYAGRCAGHGTNRPARYLTSHYPNLCHLSFAAWRTAQRATCRFLCLCESFQGYHDC